MNTLELYEFENFKGQSKCLRDNSPDLSTMGFDKKAQSLKVVGEPWIVYSDLGYGHKGEFSCFTEAEYPSIPAWGKRIRSAKIVRGGLECPTITLFDHPDYKGKAVTLGEKVSSLEHYDLNTRASSQKDVKGAWILYSEKNCKGEQMVTVTGEDIPNYHILQWGDKVSSLKPYKPSE